MSSFRAIFCVLITLCVIMPSCSVKKRVHRPGFYVSWNPGKSKARQKQTIESNKRNPTENREDDRTLVAGAERVSFVVKKAPAVAEKAVQTSPQPDAKRSGAPGVVESGKTHQDQQVGHNNRVSGGTPASDDREYSGFAIAGFVCSMIGLALVLLVGFPFLLGTTGVVLSAIGMKHTSNGLKGKGFATAGLVIGLITIMLFWLIVVAIVALLA